jgi:diguanylate cyclase (GGDEF)-like protein
LLWLTVVAVVAVTAGSTVAINRLQHGAAEQSQLRVLVTQMKVAAWHQSSLRLRAVMAHGLTPSLAEAREAVDGTVDAIGSQFEQRDPGNTQAKAVEEAFVAYDIAVDHEFDVLGAGDLLAAQRADEWQAGPAFEALTSALDSADQHYQRLAEQTAERARYGTILILFFAALTVVALVGQSHRARSRAFRRASYQASHDALTGLPNRVLLQENIAAAIDTAGGDHPGAALLLIDLDRFKEVNDTLGHHYGDQLLIQVARRLQGALRSGETVARLGGDEFAVLLPGLSSVRDVTAVAARLQDALDAPFALDALSLTAGGSIGAALFPEHGSTADELLQRADIAMYTAKTRRIGFALFDGRQGSTDPRKLTLAGDLRRGIEQGQLVVHYQPKVDAQTGTVLGAEALVRWQHPEHGLIPPDEFISLAEQTGLINPLTRFVLDAALQQCRSWLLAGHELSVAVNVSTHRLLDLSLPDEIADMLARWQVPARLLTLEITESAIMTDPDRAMQVVERLHAQGVHLSIDDFGTGYSSMAYLKTLPVHELKIDRTFVSSMTTSERDAVIVRSTVELGRNLGLRVIAEGVEDLPTWHELDAVGCDGLQGYYISRPIPVEDFERWLATQRTLTPANP